MVALPSELPAQESLGQNKEGNTDIRKVILEAVDEALGTLGESARQTIYWHIDRKYKLRREDIPEKLQALPLALDSLLLAGGRVVERLIAQSLCKKFGVAYEEHADWRLVDYVNSYGNVNAGSGQAARKS